MIQPTPRKRLNLCLCLLLSAVSSLAVAESFPGVENPRRAQVNYMLNCQGCHGAKGVASKGSSVPAMQNHVGNFLRVEGGRAFIVQVPGSANAAISDAALAELLNWMLPTFSKAQLPTEYQPYTESEITALRAQPLQDVIQTRAELVARIAAVSVQ